ncbi:MAG: FAD-dependent monooxygenase [Cyclobacteriaceae bacterium]|nr:FAD-dependent monooxygenase [Cyclobacteriaceae bacterium]MCH8517644.1 FAD-dependent monooxygenase [Cyclobacteriaceae bacterium]
MAKISIFGAGLVGSILSIMMRQRGHDVTVYEKRPDMRKLQSSGNGRSINLALSERGWRALRAVGLEEEVRKLVIPMYGRRMHDLNGDTHFQSYGKEGQAIYAVSRPGLNRFLADHAEKEGVKFEFEKYVYKVKMPETYFLMKDMQGNKDTIYSDVIIGADGAYSSLRSNMQKKGRFNFEQNFIEHGYKELTFPANDDGGFKMDPNALHIWPRGKFMLIALPNADGSFTGTLFLPYEGDNSFEQLRTNEQISHFFEEQFPDTLHLIPNLLDQFHRNPVSSLVTIKAFPWHYDRNCLILGDAAHAIVPFYGQGMNAGFEDCLALSKILDHHDADSEDYWKNSFDLFQQERKPQADAIAKLALDNFIEMRDKVGDPEFLWQKQVEARLQATYPDEWIPLYTLVTFSEYTYAQALEQGYLQNQIMEQFIHELDQLPAVEEVDLFAIIERLRARRKKLVV